MGFKDYKGNITEIERLPVNEGQKTLGIRLAPDGNNYDEYEYLFEVIQDWAEKMHKNHLPKEYVWTALQTGILRKLAYPLPATTFTQKQCDDLMGELLLTALPKAQINRYFPRVLCYAPISRGGLGLPNLYVEQGIQHLSLACSFGTRPNDITGHLLRCSLEHLKLELGIRGNLFKLPRHIWRSLATTSWWTCVWDFVDHYNIEVDFPTKDFPLARHNDIALMEFFVSRGVTDEVMLQQVNKCRLYLRLTCLSDLLTICGRRVNVQLWEGTYIEPTTSQTLVWPRQGRPSTECWRIWQQVIRQTLCPTRGNLSIERPIGSWLVPPLQWKWYLSSDQGTLLQTTESQTFNLHQLVGGTRYNRNATNSRRLDQLGPLRPLTRVAVRKLNDGHYQVISEDRTHVDWNEIVLHSPTAPLEDYRVGRILQECAWTTARSTHPLNSTTITAICKSLLKGTLKAVSDGSAKDGIASAGWVIMADGVEINGGFKVPGPAEHSDSYRAELGGMLAILTILHTVSSTYHVSNCSAEVGCDNKGVLWRVLGSDRPGFLSDSQYDLVSAIMLGRKRHSDLTLRFRHVKGHQDETMEDLDEWALWNIQADLIAKECREDNELQPFIKPLGSIWSITLDGPPVVSNAFQSIRDYCLCPPAEEYWKRTDNTDLATNISWNALAKAMQEVHPTRRRWVTKHSSGWCGVNKMKARWKLIPEHQHKCPRCNQPQETALHVWRCPHRESLALWNQRINNLKVNLLDHGSSPTIVRELIRGLRGWRNGSGATEYRGNFPHLKEALMDQERIGWEKAIYGQWSQHWSTAQQVYFDYKEDRRSGERWLSLLIVKVWDIGFALWEHRNDFNQRRLTRLERESLQLKVTLEYNEGFDSLLYKHHKLFDKPRETKLQENNQLLASWLERVEKARKLASDEPQLVARANAAETRRIRERRARREQRIIRSQHQRAIRARRQIEDRQLSRGLRRWLQRGNG